VRPKKNGGHRVILNLSMPFGDSVNDFIDKQCYSMRYSRFDDALKLIQRTGRGALLGKLDVKGAFRLIPVRKADWHLLGFQVEGLYYFDVVLPFGCRSSPYLFCLFSEALHWAFKQTLGFDPIIHYVDDYLFVGLPNSSQCRKMMDDFINMCNTAGVPLADEKTDWPSTAQIFLGILIDSVTQTISLPPGKLFEIIALVDIWISKMVCTRTELQSLIGSLQFAAKCVPAGRLFTRRLINLLCLSRGLRSIKIDDETRLDLHWWKEFLPKWNGKASFLSVNWLSPNVSQLFTDAAASVGFAGYLAGQWFQQSFAEFPGAGTHCIELLEMIPIYVACAIWAETFHTKKVLFHTDNMGCVQAWAKQGSANSSVLRLMREIVAVAAIHNFTINIVHVKGVQNEIADALSRFQLARFRKLAPFAESHAAEIPQNVVETIRKIVTSPAKREGF